MEKNRSIISVIAIISVAAIVTVVAIGCAQTNTFVYNGKYESNADYVNFSANAYDVETIIDDDSKIYQPKANVEWAFIFYLGTSMSLDNYDDILKSIASHGIAVIVPDNKFADLTYKAQESAYKKYGEINYIIGGHSQGGGAAVRRASENMQSTKACILMSPMISNDASLKDTQLPVLFFEAQNDGILNDKHKQTIKSRMNGLCEYVLLEGANHMCYGEAEAGLLGDGKNEREKSQIQAQVVDKCIEFIDGVINAEKQ